MAYTKSNSVSFSTAGARTNLGQGVDAGNIGPSETRTQAVFTIPSTEVLEVQSFTINSTNGIPEGVDTQVWNYFDGSMPPSGSGDVQGMLCPILASGWVTLGIDLQGSSIGIVVKEATVLSLIGFNQHVSWEYSLLSEGAASSITPVPTSAEDQATAIIKHKALSVRIAKSPTVIQSLRADIIKNAIQFARQLKLHRFHELGEIIRVCTALGVKRAFLRGLPHDVRSEQAIDQFIYRFDLSGAPPFVDNTTQTIIPGKIYFKPTTKVMMFYCMSNDYKSFLRLTNNVASYVIENSVDTNQIQTEVVDKQDLPDFVMIPKYRSSYIIDNVDYICQVLNNQFEFGNQQTCITTMEIADETIERPEPNRLVPVNVNPFPYMTPSASLPYNRVVYPEPVRIQKVMDGTPLDNEMLILANRFELSGTVKIQPGVDIVVDATRGEIKTDPPNLPPGKIKIGDAEYPPFPDDFEYHGPGLFILDPVKGDGTKFSTELFDNDLIELQKDETLIGGKFLTNGTNTIYYAGQEFIEYMNNSKDNVTIRMNGLAYELQYENKPLQQTFELRHITKIVEYNASYTIVKKTILDDRIKSSLFDSKTFNVTLKVDPIDPYKGQLSFISGELGGLNLSDLFEVGEGFVLSVVNDDEGTAISNVNFSFGEVVDSENKLINCFAYFPNNVTHRMGFSDTNNITLTRTAKTSLRLNDFGGATYSPTFTYHRISHVMNSDGSISDTDLRLTPDATDIFEGKISRIGFCAISQSASPSLTKQGLDKDCYVDILKSGSTINSNTFFMPAATTDRAVLYRTTDINRNPSPAHVTSAKSAITEYGMKVYNSADFNLPLGKPLRLKDIPISDTLNDSMLGRLYFQQENAGDFITIETIDEVLNPVSHGFAEDDMLTIYKREHIATPEEPYGVMVDGTKILDGHYDKCGVNLQVIEIVSPYRFLIDKTDELAKYLEGYKNHNTHHLRATNGSAVQYWSKYFESVYFDGTVDYTGRRTVTAETIVLQKKYFDSNTAANYTHTGATISDLRVGITPIKIISDPSGMGGYKLDSTNDDADAFVFVVKDELKTPPQIMDAFPLRSAKFYE